MNLNRRDFVQLTAATALAGASAGATSAAGLTLNVAVPAATVAPVAYVWMGQVLLDISGTQQAYVPPVSYYSAGN